MKRSAGVDAGHPVWDRVSHAITCSCHNLVWATGPLRIALGGGVMVGQPHLLARVETGLRASINGYVRLPKQPIICAPMLADQAGPLGPIALAASSFAAATAG